jgi:hypothetical protein
VALHYLLGTLPYCTSLPPSRTSIHLESNIEDDLAIATIGAGVSSVPPNRAMRCRTPASRSRAYRPSVHTGSSMTVGHPKLQGSMHPVEAVARLAESTRGGIQ